MGFRHASKMMAQSGQCGFYLQVVVPGTLAPGERFVVRPGERAVSIAELFRARVHPGRY
jgi:MOSC domain-containing protein YiiM